MDFTSSVKLRIILEYFKIEMKSIYKFLILRKFFFFIRINRGHFYILIINH